jgi:competence protein ComEA
MPTPGERKALLFLATVAVLGAGVRLASAIRSGTADDGESRSALREQIAAVDAARGRDWHAASTTSSPARASRARTSPRAAGSGAPKSSARSAPTAALPAAPIDSIIDVDRATAEELESLPRIGPALARRIIANRDSLGPFGSLEKLQRVKGIGPALAKLLANRVTFSGRASPLNAAAPGSPSLPGERPMRGARDHEL